MKKSYIFISPSDPIGCVILEWDYVPTVFEGKRNNGNIKWAWRCGSEDTQQSAGGLLAAAAGWTKTDTETRWWMHGKWQLMNWDGRQLLRKRSHFLSEVSREAGHKYTLHKTILLNVPYFTFDKFNFPNLFVNICWNSKYYLRVLHPLCNVTQAR